MSMNNVQYNAPDNLNVLSSSPPGPNGPLPSDVQRLATVHPSVVQSIFWLRHLWDNADLEPFGPVKKRRGEGRNMESTVYIDVGAETTALMRDLDTLGSEPTSSTETLLYELFSVVEMRFFVPEALRSLVFANLQADCLLVVRIPCMSWTNGHWTRSDVLISLAREIIAASNGFGGLDNYLLNKMAPSIRSVLVSSFIASLEKGELTIRSTNMDGRDGSGRPTSRRLERFYGAQCALVLTQIDSNGINGCIGISLFAPNEAFYNHWPSLTFLLRIRHAPPEIFSKDFLVDALHRYLHNNS